MSAETLPLLYPTVPGMAAGIIAVDPTVVQCHDCGRTATCLRWVDLILARFRFHTCEGRDGVRRCPDCLAAVEAACMKRRHD